MSKAWSDATSAGGAVPAQSLSAEPATNIASSWGHQGGFQAVAAGFQIKLARAALGWSLRELAVAAEVSPNTTTRFELGHGGPQSANLDRLQRVLEEQGVVFIPADSAGSETIRLRA
jgi:predicted transcriptional regulator